MTFTVLKWASVTAMAMMVLYSIANALARTSLALVTIDIVVSLGWAICAVSMARCKVVES